jgi:hypothetical protein
MKSYQDFRQDQIDENLIRKGAVAAFAASSKRHGNSAVQNFRSAKRALLAIKTEKSSEEQLDRLLTAIDLLLDGLIETRHQVGSVSAQITASAVTERR